VIERVEESLKFSNRYVEVYDDAVRFPDGESGTYTRITHPAVSGQAVVVLPVRGIYVGMVRTYRYPITDWQWALPRGFGQGPDRLQTARAELKEELGVVADEWDHIGDVTPDSGMLAIRVAVMVANISESSLRPEDTREVSEARWFSSTEVIEKFAAGEIEDGFTLSAVALALSRSRFPGLGLASVS
jgi:8-oxo-dGTP pyrophosphatase MutT (NUDIX family)